MVCRAGDFSSEFITVQSCQKGFHLTLAFVFPSMKIVHTMTNLTHCQCSSWNIPNKTTVNQFLGGRKRGRYWGSPKAEVCFNTSWHFPSRSQLPQARTDGNSVLTVKRIPWIDAPHHVDSYNETNFQLDPRKRVALKCSLLSPLKTQHLPITRANLICCICIFLSLSKNRSQHPSEPCSNKKNCTHSYPLYNSLI